MLNKLAALVLALATTACVADESPSDERLAVFTPATHELVTVLQSRLLNAPVADDLGASAEATCPIIATGGACDVACDPDALAEMIPAGACVAFSCLGEDGEEVRVGGCNRGEDAASPTDSTSAAARDELTRQER